MVGVVLGLVLLVVAAAVVVVALVLVLVPVRLHATIRTSKARPTQACMWYSTYA